MRFSLTDSERIISEMKEMDNEMSSYTYNYLLQAYRKHGMTVHNAIQFHCALS